MAIPCNKWLFKRCQQVVTGQWNRDGEYDLAPRLPDSLHWRFIHTFDWLAFRLSINLWYSWVLLLSCLLVLSRRGSIDCILTDCHIPTWLLFRCSKGKKKKCSALTECQGVWETVSSLASPWCISSFCPEDVSSCQLRRQHCPTPQLSSCWVIASPGTPDRNTMRNDDVLRGMKCTQADSYRILENSPREYFQILLLHFLGLNWNYSEEDARKCGC